MDFSLFGQTLPSYAYQHGMMAPGETPGEAASKTQNFIDEHLENASLAAQWLGAMGGQPVVEGRALREFGVAMHPAMDRLSPAHADQVFEGVPSDLKNLSSPLGIALEVGGVLIHSSKESKISRKLYEKSVDDLRKNYLKTFGNAAFKKATGCEKVEGCAYDYSVLSSEYWED